jgi:hypothetical protein
LITRAAIHAATAVAAVLAFGGLGVLGQAGAAGSGAPNAGPPQVICRPCGEVPPPKGYSCSGSVMIADSVVTKDIPRVTAACQKSETPATTTDKKSQSPDKTPAPKTKSPASKTRCSKKKKAVVQSRPPVPNS